MPETPSPSDMDHGQIIPEVSTLYPIDYWRLLAWIFVAPHTILRYRMQYGQDSLHIIGTWLATGFIWLPLLFPTIGYFTKHVPLSSTVATIFAVALPMSLWFVYTRKDLLGASLGAVFYVIHVIDKSAADGNVRVALVSCVALAVAFICPTIISLAVTRSLAMPPFLILTVGVGCWVAIHVGGEGFWFGLLIGAIISIPLMPTAAVVTNRIRRKYGTGRYDWVVAISLLLTSSAYGVLGWIYLLDGWNRLMD